MAIDSADIILWYIAIVAIGLTVLWIVLESD